MNILTKIRHLLLLLVLSSSHAVYAGTKVPHIILVQNSGWMLPFYDDTNSNFKDIVFELSKRLSPYGDELVIASFNQSIDSNVSPLMHYRGANLDNVKEAIRRIQVAKKPGRQTYADTDFKEAIVGAVTQFSPGRSAVIWVISNNKNSPNNSLETLEKNKEFYNFLQLSGDIKRIVAFPMPLKVQSKSIPDYRSDGLMFYAIAYGSQAEQALAEMLSQNAPFGKQPARLKPLNSEALTFVPKGVKNNNVAISLASDQKTLILSLSADSKPELAELIGRLRNDFYPYDIKSAEIKIDTFGFEAKAKQKIAVELSTNALSNIPAGGFSEDIEIKIHVPAIPSPWDPEVIFGNGYQALGTIRFNLNNQQLKISNDFDKSMGSLFPNDPLPEIFKPGKEAEQSVTSQNLLIMVEYPSWPLVVLAILAFIVLALLFFFLTYARKEKIYRVSIDGTLKNFAIKPFSQMVLKNEQGERVGMLKRGLGKPVALLDKDKTCSVRIL